MVNKRRNHWIFGFMAIIVIALAGYVAGFVVCIHARKSATNEDRNRELQQPGNAPPAVHDAVIATLQEFQRGYTARDPQQLAPFMSRLFAPDQDVLLEGTDSEWARGYSQASQFVENDWKGWGNLKLNTKDAVVWSNGDVAWMTTLGVVSTNRYAQPLRFNAVLNRDGADWHFRQISFQWDERTPSSADVFRFETYQRLLAKAMRHFQR